MAPGDSRTRVCMALGDSLILTCMDPEARWRPRARSRHTAPGASLRHRRTYTLADPRWKNRDTQGLSAQSPIQTICTALALKWLLIRITRGLSAQSPIQTICTALAL